MPLPSRATRVREALAFAVLACACGMTARPPASTSTQTSTSPRSPTQAPTVAPTLTDGGAALTELAARWAPFVPGMHVVAAREDAADSLELARATTTDLCLRVAFDASDPVVVTLASAAGATLASSAEGVGGLLASEGPVCIRRGDALRATAVGPPGARVRWIAWSSGPP
jgi:hypothetical protein